MSMAMLSIGNQQYLYSEIFFNCVQSCDNQLTATTGAAHMARNVRFS